MAGYFKVIPTHDGGARLTSTRDVAKNVLFGWADGGMNAAFYGRSTGRRGASGDEWQWTLTPGEVGRMIGYVDQHINNPSYYKGAERKAAIELQRKLIDARSR